jgi:hypothetical protein
VDTKSPKAGIGAGGSTGMTQPAQRPRG